MIEGYETLRLVLSGFPRGSGGGPEPGHICWSQDSSNSATFILTIVDDDLSQEKQASGAGGKTTSSGSAAATVTPRPEPISAESSSEDSRADAAVPPAEPQSQSQEARSDQLGPDAPSATRSNGVVLAIVIVAALTLSALAIASVLRARSENGK